MDWLRRYSIDRALKPFCPVCGDHPTIKELIDYDPFGGIPVEIGRAILRGSQPAPAEAAAPQANKVTVWIQAFDSKLGIAQHELVEQRHGERDVAVRGAVAHAFPNQRLT